MKLKNVKISNIRSFKEQVEFSPREDFNVLIGSNGSGKSNLLDIVYITLRHYFLYPYQLNKSSDGIKLMRITAPCGKIECVLPKFIGCENNTEIIISLEITRVDTNNLHQIIENKENLKDLMTTYSYNTKIPIDFLDTQIVELKEGQIFEYQIKGYECTIVSEEKIAAEYYLKYLNAFEGIFLAAKEQQIQLESPMIYISPFRAVNRIDLEICLSNSGYHEERGEIAKITSRTTSSLIKLASLFFAEKRRKFEAEPKGYEELWNHDHDVKFVTESLDKIGYKWDIKLIDSNKNVYIIQLEKDNRKFLLSEASSGEIELINFILGLITLNLQDGIIIIDEPELHLHPQWLAILRDFFMKFSKEKRNQLIISTHSATFINTTTYPFIYRIYKNSEGSSLIHQVKIRHKDETKDRLHFINATNNEKVLFSDFVLMVEGDTDEIVFKQILQDIREKENFKQNVEVMQVRGKTNYDKFKEFLHTLNIPTAFIGDIDNINQMAIGNKEIKEMLITNAERINRLVIKNPGAKDNEGLLKCLKEAIDNGNIDQLRDFYDYMISFRTKIRQDLTAEQKEKLYKFIESKHPENIFILPKGEIESYFPNGFKGKDLNKVLALTKGEEYEQWKKEEGYHDLHNIVRNILIKNKILS